MQKNRTYEEKKQKSKSTKNKKCKRKEYLK